MNKKPPGVEEEALDWEGPQDESAVDAWIERNRAPLEKRLAEAKDDFAAGRCRELSLEEVLSESSRRRKAKGDHG